MRWFRSEYVRSLEQQVEDLKQDKADLRRQLIEANLALAKALQVQQPKPSAATNPANRPTLASFPRTRDYLERISVNRGIEIQEIEPADRQEKLNGKA